MFQPRVKLEFVRRYCPPEAGWSVCVDIDPSEEGNTGSERISEASRRRQTEMQTDAPLVRSELAELGAKRALRDYGAEMAADQRARIDAVVDRLAQILRRVAFDQMLHDCSPWVVTEPPSALGKRLDLWAFLGGNI